MATGLRQELMSLKSASMPASAMRNISPSEPSLSTKIVNVLAVSGASAPMRKASPLEMCGMRSMPTPVGPISIPTQFHIADSHNKLLQISNIHYYTNFKGVCQYFWALFCPILSAKYKLIRVQYKKSPFAQGDLYICCILFLKNICFRVLTNRKIWL